MTSAPPITPPTKEKQGERGRGHTLLHHPEGRSQAEQQRDRQGETETRKMTDNPFTTTHNNTHTNMQRKKILHFLIIQFSSNQLHRGGQRSKLLNKTWRNQRCGRRRKLQDRRRLQRANLNGETETCECTTAVFLSVEQLETWRVS